MLRFKNYLLEYTKKNKFIINPKIVDESPRTGTVKELISMPNGSVLTPGQEVTVLRTVKFSGMPKSDTHIIRNPHSTGKRKIPILAKFIELESDAQSKAAKLEKKVVTHLHDILSTKTSEEVQLKLAAVPEDIKPHVTALHNKIIEALGGQKISNVTNLTKSSTAGAKIATINNDRSQNKRSDIEEQHHHLVIGTDLVVHTDDGHSHYFDLKLPSRSGSYSLHSPRIQQFMNTIKKIHPDYEGHNDYEEKMKKANENEMAELTATRINQMNENEKNKLYSHINQNSTEENAFTDPSTKPSNFTSHRLIYQQDNQKITSEILGQKIPVGNISVTSEGRSVVISHPHGPKLSIHMRVTGGKRVTVKPPRSK